MLERIRTVRVAHVRHISSVQIWSQLTRVAFAGDDTSRRVVMLFLRRGSLDEYLNRSGVLRIIDGDETRVHADLH